MSDAQPVAYGIVRRERIIAAIFACVILGAILGSPMLPTHDGFHHLLHGYLWNHLHDPTTGYDRFLARGGPITAWGFTWLYAPLERLFDWQLAFKLSLATIALGLAGGARALIHAIAGRHTPVGLLGFSVALSWPLFMGFLPFCVATAAALYLMAFVARRDEPTPRDHLVFGAALLIIAMLHIFPAILAGGAAFLFRAMRGRRGVKHTACTVLAGIPAACIAILVLNAGQEIIDSNASTTNHMMWQSWTTRLLDLGRTTIGGPVWRWALPVAAAVSGLFAWRDQGRAAAAVALLGFLGALGLPFHMTAWEFLAPRPLLIATVCGWGAAGTLVARHDRHVLVVATLAASLAVAWGSWHVRDLAYDTVGLTQPSEASPSAQAQRQGWFLPIVFQGDAPSLTRVAYARPIGNIGDVFVIRHGGMTPYLFATSPTIHPHLFRDDAPAVRVPERDYIDILAQGRSPDMIAAVETHLLSAASGYEESLIVDHRSMVPRALERGFIRSQQSSERAQLLTFEGCPTSVRVVDGAPHSPVAVVWGWHPLQDATNLTEGLLDDGGATTLELDNPPCGAIWFEVHSTDGALRCAPGAPVRIVANRSADTPDIVCSIQRG